MKIFNYVLATQCLTCGILLSSIHAAPPAQAYDFIFHTYNGMNDAQLLVLSARSILGNLLFALPTGAFLAYLITPIIAFFLQLPPLIPPDLLLLPE